MPPHWSIYHLTRFFAKTTIFSSFKEDLRWLVGKNLLTILNTQDRVKVYRITECGQASLDEKYKTNDIKHYVLEIEPTGFILKMLYAMDSKS